jgi:hypothetical protein
LALQGGENMTDRVEKTSWPDVAVTLFDLLTGRKAEVTWKFERMEVHVPITTGSNTEYAVWKINGVLKVRAREELPT